jgi:polysaccharide export outer membrane protein
MSALNRRLIVLLASLSLLTTVFAEEQMYRFGAGDEIEILVHQEDDLSMRVRLSESGVFTYPYLGTITAKGKTAAELEAELTDGLLQDILVRPSVHVAIVGYRNFYIGGEVKRPGAYPYQPGITIKQAIAVAGGLTEWASSSKFEILKEGDVQTSPASDKTLIRPGDTVTVKEGLF